MNSEALREGDMNVLMVKSMWNPVFAQYLFYSGKKKYVNPLELPGVLHKSIGHQNWSDLHLICQAAG
jgi:hypothetical protein